MADVVPLPAAAPLDVPSTLRRWADAIEAGVHGDVTGCALVVNGERLRVAYAGRGEVGPQLHLLLHAGAALVVRRVTDGRS